MSVWRVNERERERGRERERETERERKFKERGVEQIRKMQDRYNV